MNGILCQSDGREINVTSSSIHAWNTVGTEINNVHHYIVQRNLSWTEPVHTGYLSSAEDVSSPEDPNLKYPYKRELASNEKYLVPCFL
jgi:hypothetical protein